jgi:hypothetical protein
MKKYTNGSWRNKRHFTRFEKARFSSYSRLCRWTTSLDMVIVTNDEPDDKYQKEDDENAITIEKPPKLTEAIEMIRRLHLLATVQYPRLHSTVALNSIHNVLKSTSTPKDLNTLQRTTISAKIENIVVFLK